MSTESNDHKDKLKSNFSINESFLKQEQAIVSNNAVDKKEADLQEFAEHQIDSMGAIERGSPLLTQLPHFATSAPIKVAVNEMEVPQLAHYVFGELLSLSYVLSSEVEQMREKLVLSIQQDVSPQELFQITRQVLSQQKVEVYTKDNIIYVNKASNRVLDRSIGIGRNLEDLPESGDDVIQLVPYVYNSSRSIISILGKLTNAKAYSDNTNRLLVMEGKRADIERALQIVNMLDVPHARGRDIRMLSMVYLSPDALIGQMEELMKAEGLQIGEDIAMVPINRLNAVVVYSGNSTLGDRVSMWARMLDVATGGESERMYVYRPNFAKASDLVKSLQAVLGSMTSGIVNNNPNQASGNIASTKSGTGSIRITADESQNAIVINTSPSKYQEVLALLEQLDRMPGQVALQVIVAEVELSDNVSAGIDWFYDSKANHTKSATLGLKSTTGSLSFLGFNGNWNVALQMLASKTNTRVLARPYLVVRDGESASINSGQQVPIITEFRESDSSDNVRTSVQYRSTGISLSVTPIINADGVVSLQISQETSKSSPNTLSSIPSPTITSRSISTNVLAGNGQTIILGGLIQEDLNENDSRVPLLGDIPILGRLFQTKGNDFSRSELMVLITPRIIKDTTELDEFGRKLSELYSFPINQ
ncbi:secretin N-terminal domain-containing protein [Rheinheimera sp. MMS21-TC3]|uniref:secretin N-terminal domain-containing protein n=1 Tax=Rheinheimera sp. MMS21-TC3 TaxID=3072790 RepID=UPI0028C5000A|nr:secretin N-terminal domain-containing protein [Rheinheimera sp. MMS21-TC3]WNO61656.1 secretin N-terminal domain-containing protein [Rheinheimera sp. MMS21-TC3]